MRRLAVLCNDANVTIDACGGLTGGLAIRPHRLNKRLRDPARRKDDAQASSLFNLAACGIDRRAAKRWTIAQSSAGGNARFHRVPTSVESEDLRQPLGRSVVRHFRSGRLGSG